MVKMGLKGTDEAGVKMEELLAFQDKMILLFQQHGLSLKIEKDSPIFQEGERAEDIFFIKEGAVQISQQTESGKELTIRICSKGVIIGENSMFCHVNYHSTTAIATEQTELLALSKGKLEMLLTQHPNLLVEYLKWLQVENIKNQTRMRDLVMHGKKGALFSTLIRLANTFGKIQSDQSIFINFSLTNSEIANLCGTSREMINRMLNDLKKHHIISFNKGYITILNLGFLKREIECADCPLIICRID